MSFLEPEIKEIINEIQNLPSLSLTMGYMKIKEFDKDEDKFHKIQKASNLVEKYANNSKSSLPEPEKSSLQEFIASKNDLSYSTDSEEEEVIIATYFSLNTLKNDLSED